MGQNRGTNYFTRALDENQNIDEKFINLMHDTFDGLYNAMGKNNFLRWINTRKISERIKKLVVEEFSKADIEKYPNWVGYYTRGTNKQKLKEGHNDKRVSSHESLHFLTDGVFIGENFPIFIDEGLTEYLTREFEKINTQKENVKYSYAQNVDFVEFLHNIIGDSLIKAYLTGTSKTFSEEFSTYITENGTINIQELENFYDSLNRVHKVLHPTKNPETNEEKNKSQAEKESVIEDDYPKLRNVVENIVSNAIRKKAHDLEYYEDGKLAISKAIKDIKELTEKSLELLGKNGIFGVSKYSSKGKIDLQENMIRASLKAVLKESHISDEKIEDILGKTIKKGVIEVKENVTTTIKPEIIEEILISEINKEENTVENLITKRLGNKENYMIDGQFNITAFLLDTSLVLDKMNLDSKSRNLYLDSAILRYLPEDMNHSLVKNLIDKHSKLYVAIYQKQQENKRNVVDSKYVKISDTEFIEKRDNKIFFIEFNEETGTFKEKLMMQDYSNLNRRFPKETLDKFGGTIIGMTHKDKNAQYNMIFNEDFSTVIINGKEYGVLEKTEGLGESFLIDEAMKPVLDGIKNNTYVSILDDGEKPEEGALYTNILPDTRSRVVNYKLFLEDLKNNISNVPKNLRKDIEKMAISSLISRTYLVKPENMEELQNYIGGISLENITDEKNVAKLYGFTEKLNQSRRAYVENKAKYNAISFRTEDSKRKWKENLEAKNKREQIEKFNQDIFSFVATNSKECILETLEIETEKEHYSTMEGVIYSRKEQVQYRTAAAGKVDYIAFCDKLKERLSSITEDKSKAFIRRVIRESVDIWYGAGSGYGDEVDIISNERWDLTDELIDILENRINGNKQQDMSRISEIEKRFLELSEEEKTICQGILEKRKPLWFENADVQSDFEYVEEIKNDLTEPEDTKKKMIEVVNKRSQKRLQEKRKMNAFIKLALKGRGVPNETDIKNASRILDFYNKSNDKEH